MKAIDAEAVASCENCGTPLQGSFCHACGQSVHNPLRHFGHAVEEFFEAFWHLDGRVFRTLRDLMSPGRVARNYLAGHRVRYIAPLRLFVILSLLTFFVGKLVMHVDTDRVGFDGREAAIGQAQTVAEVERVRDELLKEISAAEAARARVPGVDGTLVAARARIQGEAASRIAELERETPPAKPGTTTPASPTASGESTAEPGLGNFVKPGGQAWDAKDNPVDVGWLPGWANGWINAKIERAEANLDRMEANEDEFLDAFFGAVPSALFLLMPVFALLLKVLYLGTGRAYLEHLVVALYSHVWLLLVLLALFIVGSIDEWIGTLWAGWLSGLGAAALWLWMPVYLFLMQRRVYGGHWAVETLRYVVIGSVYMVLVTFAALYAVLAGIAS